MTRLRSICPLPIEFVGSSASVEAAKAVIPLECALPPWFEDMAAEEAIRSFEILQQNTSDYPSGIAGNLGVAIDPAGDFIARSGFPSVEKWWPDTACNLGIMEMRPGAAHVLRNEFLTPILYRPGVDLMYVAPGVAPPGDGSYGFQVLMSVGFDGAPWTLREGIVLRSQHNIDAPGNDNYCVRNLIPSIAAGGTEVRVALGAWRSGLTPGVYSIGVQSGSGPDTVATPVPLTVDSASPISCDPWRRVWTDWASLSTTAGMNLIANCDMFNGAEANNWAERGKPDMPGAGIWYSGTASVGNATMQGTPTWSAGRTVAVLAVQVR